MLDEGWSAMLRTIDLEASNDLMEYASMRNSFAKHICIMTHVLLSCEFVCFVDVHVSRSDKASLDVYEHS